MANINTPAHDFAPPWLKIPTYESNKPSGADRGGHASRKESSHNPPRQAKDNDNFNSSRHLCNDTRADRNNCDDISYYDVSSVQNSYTNNFNGTSNSQSAVLRRPHSRHDFRNGPSYSKQTDATYRHLSNNGGNYYNKPKGKCPDTYTTNNSNSLFEDNGGINVSSNTFNQEFPSLQGDVTEEQALSPPAVNGSVWEKHRSITGHRSGVGKKIQLIKKPFHSDVNSEVNKKSLTGPSLPSSSSIMNSSGNSSAVNPHTVIVTPVAKGSSGIYRALVPAKQSNGKKIMATKETSSSKAQLITKKPAINSSASSNHSMEILVKHPKAPGNKSDFLKALRNENKDAENAEKDSCQLEDASGEFRSGGMSCGKNKSDNSLSNGIDIAKMSVSDDGEKPLLSSSLEAEQRLLREMGWKEDDDDDNFAPLTEDEMQEFRALSEQIVKRNGIRRNLQANFSPRRLAPYPLTLPADTCSSSSESDSDF